MLAPSDSTARLIDLLHRDVRHEAVGRRAVPVVLERLEEHAVTGAYDLDLAAVALAEPDALGDVDGLAVGVRVPRSASSRREVNAAG
jgi:hypothetical protein